ncbi:helix-turn-helix domain-containing protein [Flavobacterium difficile]|uniref:Helix-turn-helix domain-containing protein n=1 Tax=Flavobacterium difficile TaxID=2709659 RepID=A0ABX0I4V3_9FLAO|nr:helix-turn-helix transcriptional regulator [Flavobacterium difficile]NHM02167.1 helix-turn-helix domain-containing protein [Flavobacterium difficile]
MLSLHLQPIFKARGIEKPYTFLVKNGFTPHAAHNLLNAKTRVFRLDHIELLCEILICEPNDLLLWQPISGKQIAANHPLKKLSHTTDSETDLKKALFNLPYNQLKDISSKLTNEINDINP